jgi:hypothetical protein
MNDDKGAYYLNQHGMPVKSMPMGELNYLSLNPDDEDIRRTIQIPISQRQKKLVLDEDGVYVEKEVMVVVGWEEVITDNRRMETYPGMVIQHLNELCGHAITTHVKPHKSGNIAIGALTGPEADQITEYIKKCTSLYDAAKEAIRAANTPDEVDTIAAPYFQSFSEMVEADSIPVAIAVKTEEKKPWWKFW